MTDNTITPAGQKLTEEQFKQLAHEELEKTGICTEKEIDAIVALSILMERSGMYNKLQEK